MAERLKTYWLQNPALRFIAVFLGLFTLLYYFNLFVIGITSEGNYYSAFLDNNLNYISALRSLLLNISSRLLEGMGYQVFTSEYTLHVKDHGGFNIVYSCLGFGVMSFFVAFVVAYPKSLKSKLSFIPAGLILIQVLNIIRFIVMALFYLKNRNFLGMIDHHAVYNTILYLILIAAIYVWINYSKKSHTNQLIS